MKKKFLKSILTMTMICTLSATTIIPAYAKLNGEDALLLSAFNAGTANYDLTVTKTGSSSDDNKSLRTSKDGGANYEAKFYVRPTYFSCSARKGKMRVHSLQWGYPKNVTSNELVISKTNLNTTKSANYTYKVPAKEYYYLIAGYYSGSINSVRSKGKYTP